MNAGCAVRTVLAGVLLLLPAVPSWAVLGESGGHPIGNCATYADESYTWGPVVTADIQLAGEKAVSVPIQLVGASGFAGARSDCSNGGTAAHTADALSAPGLLGLGVFRQDCGPACSPGGASPPPPVY